MREPILSETDAPPRRRSLTLATQQKSFLHIFYFAHARFFLLKGKENFFAGFCSERAGRRGFASARARRNSPHAPLPPRPRFGYRRNLYFASQNAPQEKEVLPLPQPTRARATIRNSLDDFCGQKKLNCVL